MSTFVLHPRLLPALLAAAVSIALACAAPPARAIEVDTVNGKTTADRLSFDGKKFTIFSDTGKLTLDPAQVKLFSVDETRAATLQKDKDALAAQLEEQKKLVLALRANVEATSATLVKREAEAAELRARIKEGSRAEDPAPALRRQIDTLKEDNRQATVRERELQDQINQLKRTSGGGAAAAAAPKPVPFVVDCQAPVPAKAPGLVTVTGTVTNPRTQHYDTVIVEVTALDSGGKPLAVATTFVSNVDAGAKRDFTTDVEVPDPVKAVSAKGVVAEAD